MRNVKRSLMTSTFCLLLPCAVGANSEIGHSVHNGGREGGGQKRDGQEQRDDRKRVPGGLTLTRGDAPPDQGERGTPPLAVSPDRLLVGVGDTLYMLGGKQQVVWKRSFGGNNVTDVAYDGRGRIFVTATDGLLVALDTSGRQVWSNFLNGSGNYVQIECFGDDGFLVVVDMAAYRGRFDTEDVLQYWKGGEVVWRKEFPRGAELYVWGGKILALTRTSEGTTVKEIL